MVGIAETGSGKTLAYVLPMIRKVESQNEVLPGEGPVGLVIVATRELCAQVADVVNWFAVRRDPAKRGSCIPTVPCHALHSDERTSNLSASCAAILVATPCGHRNYKGCRMQEYLPSLRSG